MHLVSFPVYLAGASFHNHWINIFQSVTRIIQVSRYSLFAEPWQKTVQRLTCTSSNLLSDLLWIPWEYTGCMLMWVGLKEDFKKLKCNITIHDKFKKYSDNVNDFSWSQSCLMPQERPKNTHPYTLSHYTDKCMIRLNTDTTVSQVSKVSFYQRWWHLIIKSVEVFTDSRGLLLFFRD